MFKKYILCVFLLAFFKVVCFWGYLQFFFFFFLLWSLYVHLWQFFQAYIWKISRCAMSFGYYKPETTLNFSCLSISQLVWVLPGGEKSFSLFSMLFVSSFCLFVFVSFFFCFQHIPKQSRGRQIPPPSFYALGKTV